MKEGIENIKNCVGFVLDITEDVQSAMSDGKFSVKDTVHFIGDIPQVPKVIRSAAKFWDEFQDLDETEQAEIVVFVIDRLNCNTAKAKAIIVQSFKTGCGSFSCPFILIVSDIELFCIKFQITRNETVSIVFADLVKMFPI